MTPESFVGKRTIPAAKKAPTPHGEPDRAVRANSGPRTVDVMTEKRPVRTRLTTRTAIVAPRSPPAAAIVSTMPI